MENLPDWENPESAVSPRKRPACFSYSFPEYPITALLNPSTTSERFPLRSGASILTSVHRNPSVGSAAAHYRACKFLRDDHRVWCSKLLVSPWPACAQQVKEAAIQSAKIFHVRPISLNEPSGAVTPGSNSLGVPFKQTW